MDYICIRLPLRYGVERVWGTEREELSDAVRAVHVVLPTVLFQQFCRNMHLTGGCYAGVIAREAPFLPSSSLGRCRPSMTAVPEGTHEAWSARRGPLSRRKKGNGEHVPCKNMLLGRPEPCRDPFVNCREKGGHAALQGKDCALF